MALFDEKKEEYEILREGEDTTIRINCDIANISPSIEDSPNTMAFVTDKLIENNSVTKIIFVEKRDYEYDNYQIAMLMEVAQLYNHIKKQRDIYSYGNLGVQTTYTRYIQTIYNELQTIIANLIRSDPLGAYVELKRILRREEINLDKAVDQSFREHIKRYIAVLNYLLDRLGKTRLLTIAMPYLAGYNLEKRDVYRKVFSPAIKPDFMFTKLMADYPPDGEELDSYTIGDDIEITIFSMPNTVKYHYHVIPPEFKLDEDQYELLDTARKILSEHKPKHSEFVDPARMRQVFANVGRDLLEELANYKKLNLRSKEIEKLTKILVRYTVGFGLIEVLLQDEKVQDISINSPMGRIPMFIVHADFDDCDTNIIPMASEAESWATKLRMISGRPLDEANPILDTELELPGANTRVSVITAPLDPQGIAFSFRRHRDKPWTLPLFIKNNMINSLAAGLLSFLVDGTRTMLIAGTRSSGKSSFLSSLLVEIMRRYRIITIEDTLELPCNSLRKLGFNIQQMKVASALSKGSSEMSASDGIRSTLRLGDSSLIIGEVRSKEAVALYEAMRIGAAANVVAGTIHGDSPYGVFDRVVNDIGVPKTSFKATDIIIVANPIKSADGLHKFRRVTQITEVGKMWDDDPLKEGGFVDLMKYDAKTDDLIAQDGLTNGESEILKTIAGNIKDFAGNWDAVWDNIQLRAKIKQAIVDMSIKLHNADMLEAPFVILCNDMFHIISEKVKAETDTLDAKLIYTKWEAWFKREAKKKFEKKG